MVEKKPFWSQLSASQGLPWWLSVQESVCNAREAGWIPGSGRSPGEGNDNSLQYSCLESPTDRRAWQATVCVVSRVGNDWETKPPPSNVHLNCSCTSEALDAWATSPDFGVTGLGGSPEQLPRNSPWAGPSEKSVKVSVSHSVVSDSLQPRGLYVAHQAPLFTEFSRQEYRSGLPFPSPGDLPNPGKPPLKTSALAVLNACRFLSCSMSSVPLPLPVLLPPVHFNSASPWNLPWPSWQRPLLWYYSTVRFVLNASVSTVVIDPLQIFFLAASVPPFYLGRVCHCVHLVKPQGQIFSKFDLGLWILGY